MITLLLIISITMLIISIIFNKKCNEARKDNTGWFTPLKKISQKSHWL